VEERHASSHASWMHYGNLHRYETTHLSITDPIHALAGQSALSGPLSFLPYPGPDTDPGAKSPICRAGIWSGACRWLENECHHMYSTGPLES